MWGASPGLGAHLPLLPAPAKGHHWGLSRELEV